MLIWWYLAVLEYTLIYRRTDIKTEFCAKLIIYFFWGGGVLFGYDVQLKDVMPMVHLS